MQQAQVNLLADMGAQPTTLMTGPGRRRQVHRHRRTHGHDHLAGRGAADANGASVTVTGTATDAGGGRVAGVEVSTDGGATWHPATGTTSWTYTYVQHGIGCPAHPGPRHRRQRQHRRRGHPLVTVACPCSVFGRRPVLRRRRATDDAGAVELGLRFTPPSTASSPASASTRAPGTAAPTSARLWSANGQRARHRHLHRRDRRRAGRRATFSDAGRRSSAGQTYVVVVHRTARPLRDRAGRLLRAGRSTPPRSRSTAASAPRRPGSSATPGSSRTRAYQNSNYYVDVVFSTTDTSPLDRRPTSWPLAGSSVGAAEHDRLRDVLQADDRRHRRHHRSRTPTARRSPGTTRTTPRPATVTFTPSAPLAGFVSTPRRSAAPTPRAAASSAASTWSFTTARAARRPGSARARCSTTTMTPTRARGERHRAGHARRAVQQPSTAGTVTGVRFYKGANNTGAHVGTLWIGDGTQLADRHLHRESTSGWQTLTFATPVAIAKTPTYVASYRADVRALLGRRPTRSRRPTCRGRRCGDDRPPAPTPTARVPGDARRPTTWSTSSSRTAPPTLSVDRAGPGRRARSTCRGARRSSQVLRADPARLRR